MKKWSPSYSYSYQRPVNQQKPHYQMTKRQSQSNRKKIEHKTYFSNKGERLLLCILVCRKKNRTYKCILLVPGTYISIWIEETIAYSKLQDIFQRRNIILAHFGLWQEPNQICPVTQVYFVRVFTYLHLIFGLKRQSHIRIYNIFFNWRKKVDLAKLGLWEKTKIVSTRSVSIFG